LAAHISDKIPLLVLVGPTAVGKSNLALNIASNLKIDIISADSAQVYRRLNIGTAKPFPEEQKLITHHLIDLVDPDQDYSVADYQKDADTVIRQLWIDGKIPFMVGGTGLYIKAVTDRYAFGSKGSNRKLRSSYERLAQVEGLDKLYQMLKSVDPTAASKIHANDQRRIIRALEVYATEGEQISMQATRTNRQGSPYKTIIFGINCDRNLLYSRIEKRVDKMIEQGFLDEVKDLYNAGYNENTPGMQILGYRQLLAYLRNKLCWDDAVDEIKKQTRNLAKRQLTWFRREDRIEWIEIYGSLTEDNISEIICRKVKDITLKRENSSIT
jgi:tRNA dimethylallyltransferase